VYLALVHGVVTPSSGLIDVPIREDEPKKYALQITLHFLQFAEAKRVLDTERLSVGEGGKEASTQFEVVEQFSQAALVRFRPR
jgi:23S rRNA-/tRNA-specific pseudouridylate synthase